jgi:hypothetical protein
MMQPSKQKVIIPNSLHAVIAGSTTIEKRNKVLEKVLYLKKHTGPIFLCSRNLESFNLNTEKVSKCESIHDLPKHVAGSLIILDEVPNSLTLRSLYNTNDVSTIYIREEYRHVPSDLCWYFNYAFLFPTNKSNIALFHLDLIYGMSLDVFEDMCEFVWESNTTAWSEHYLVVDLTRWIYMMNFQHSIHIDQKL